ncbi:hypothetical protein NW768_006788 [Fusarium equiseti]|uniref:Uncharacterized protein n=1 Tax=Fusarium equiseti TaxID=61235 RepID=A0ABQ8R9S0_FUSEQ|nr:hypothetical protein NW768_006788 [Fusarium equiseti]
MRDGVHPTAHFFRSILDVTRHSLYRVPSREVTPDNRSLNSVLYTNTAKPVCVKETTPSPKALTTTSPRESFTQNSAWTKTLSPASPALINIVWLTPTPYHGKVTSRVISRLSSSLTDSLRFALSNPNFQQQPVLYTREQSDGAPSNHVPPKQSEGLKHWRGRILEATVKFLERNVDLVLPMSPLKMMQTESHVSDPNYQLYDCFETAFAIQQLLPIAR